MSRVPDAGVLARVMAVLADFPITLPELIERIDATPSQVMAAFHEIRRTHVVEQMGGRTWLITDIRGIN